MKIEVEERGSTVIISYDGDLSLKNIDEFDHSFKRYVNSGLDVIALDLKYIEHLDSFGLSRIIKVSRAFAGSTTEFIIINMNQDIHRIFKITTFDKFFKIMTMKEFSKKYFPDID